MLPQNIWESEVKWKDVNRGLRKNDNPNPTQNEKHSAQAKM
jgi:hypothetical protein